MYDHIGLKVSDLDASVRFYSAALAPLGYALCSRDASGAGFGRIADRLLSGKSREWSALPVPGAELPQRSE